MNYSLPWLNLLTKLGIKYFIKAHGFDVYLGLKNPRYLKLYKKYNKCSGIVVNTPLVKSQLMEIGIMESKIHVIPCGIDIPKDLPNKACNNRDIKVLSVGRMVPVKAPTLTLTAFKKALSKVKNLKMDYVGDGPLLQEAKSFAAGHGLGEHVWFHEALEHSSVLELFMASDIYIQHSRPDPITGQEESLGVSIIEAMAHGLPVVSTKSGGIPWVVKDNVTGFLGTPEDSDAMADSLVTLATNRDIRKKLGLAGYERAKERFSWEREKSELLTLMGMTQ